MTTPTYVNVGTRATGSSVTSLTPGLPGSRVNGNLLIAIINTNLLGVRTFNTPSGWNQITCNQAANGNNVGVYWRLVDGTEAAPAFSWTGSTDAQGIVAQYQNVAGTRPIGYWTKEASAQGGAGTSWVQRGLDTYQNGSLAALIAVANTNVTVPTPSGYTSRSNNAGATGTIAFFDVDMTTQGYSGDVSATYGTSSRWYGIVIEIGSSDFEPGYTNGFPRLCQDSEVVSATFTGASSKTVTLHTGTPNSTVVAIVYNEKNTTPQITTSSVSGGSGLSWANPTSSPDLNDQITATGSKGDLQVWWATAAAIQTSQTITVTLSAATDDSWVVLFSIAGADYRAINSVVKPFDVLGVVANNTGSNNTLQTTGVSSTSNPVMEVFTFGCWDNADCNVPSGFTQIAKPQNSGGSLFAFGNVGLKYSSSTVSSQTRTVSTNSTQDKWQAFSFFFVPLALKAALTATDFTQADSNSFGTPASSGLFSLTASDFAGASPAFDTPHLSGTVTTLTATDFAGDAAVLGTPVLLPTIQEVFTAGAFDVVVPPYARLVIELWGAGGSGDTFTSSTGAHGSDGADSTIGAYSLTAGGGNTSAGTFWDTAPAGLGGTAAGGNDANIVGTAGDPGGKEVGGTSVPASVDGGGGAPAGGAGGARHTGGGSTGGAFAGNDGSAPGAGGGAARLVGFGLAFGGWFAKHGAGAGSGGYVRHVFDFGDPGAPAAYDHITGTIGAGAAAASGTVESGAGADGGVRITALPASEIASEPTDSGDATVDITGPNTPPQVGDVLHAVFNDDDPDGPATGHAYQWQRGGVDITGATGATYATTADDFGANITVEVDYFDGQGFAEHIESAAVGPVAAHEAPLDYFEELLETTGTDHIYAAYSVRLLRNSYTGPLLRLGGSNVPHNEQDFYADENGDLDIEAIQAWRLADSGGTEFGPTHIVKWYDQWLHGRDMNGHWSALTNAPKLAVELPELPDDEISDVFRIPNGRPSPTFLGNQKFRRSSLSSVPTHALSFMAVVVRDNDYPDDVFKFTENLAGTTDAGFAIKHSTAQDWLDDNAVFIGHGSNSGRAPRAITVNTYATDDTDDAVIWDGELTAVRNGIRRNGHPQALAVNDHSSFTAPPTANLDIGPDQSVTGKEAKIPEIVLFRTDVREEVGPLRTSAAFYFQNVPDYTTSEFSEFSFLGTESEPPTEIPSFVVSESGSEMASEPPSSGAEEIQSETFSELPPDEPLAYVSVTAVMS